METPMEHFPTAGIEDFLACLLPREQNQLVVRHLLARCPTYLSEVQLALYPAKASSKNGAFLLPRQRSFFAKPSPRFLLTNG